MQILNHLVLLSLCVWVHGALLGNIMRRHSGYGAYIDNHRRPYDQIIFAAIPLHGPMPVLQVLSRRPLPYERTYEPSVEHPVYVRAPYQDNDYAPSTHNDYEYTEPEYEDRPAYLESLHYGSTRQVTAPTESATDDDVTIIYARPNPRGGFIYRRRPTKNSPKKTPVTTTESPVILRVHKYKIVKEK